MVNPWVSLEPENTHYILPGDVPLVTQHNQAVGRDFQIVEESIPEPFIGDPNTARVILLGLNPGHSEADAHDYGRADFRTALFQNLRHETRAYPFYPLHPDFKNTGTAAWWTRRLQTLEVDCGLDRQKLADRLMVIEWYPYHSRKFRRRGEILRSQIYSFRLAQKMIEMGRLVVRMRSRRLWNAVGKEFETIHSLSNPQCGHVSPRNARDCYKIMIERLKAPNL